MFQRQSSGFFMARAIATLVIFPILGFYLLSQWIGLWSWTILLALLTIGVAAVYVFRPFSRWSANGANEQEYNYAPQVTDRGYVPPEYQEQFDQYSSSRYALPGWENETPHIENPQQYPPLSES
jgi:hypothetical protein